jgi:hypothetical protein
MKSTLCGLMVNVILNISFYTTDGISKHVPKHTKIQTPLALGSQPTHSSILPVPVHQTSAQACPRSHMQQVDTV